MITDTIIYRNMAEIIPEGKSGEWGIRHYTMSEEKAQHERAMAATRGDWTCRELQPGTYCTLYWGNGGRSEIMMSDTWLEQFTNRELIYQANGHVLVVGLGIGLVLLPLCNKPDVISVTVIENCPDVIKLVAPHVQHPKLIVVEADIFNWQPEQKYDTIYFDIWAHISSDNYPGMKELHKKFKYTLNRANPNCWMESWLRWEAKRLWKQEQ